ncbi:hypothetical protein J31TS4_33220 [Paenibacillus sp. J31TS4]|uniref:general stress protein n=1 Tax=Paenibacillus sp. J31TS4 TaxID=2807195 RepID=UPI001B26A2E6|nr:general stress protein [Paenibacillus sp. J31TS4]GIP40042.1 hypothetical protein J31TS4_33220 [Paenibacillus sp. J31TS4]
MATEKKVVGVFETEEEAIRAIDDLKAQGYSSDDISVVAKNRDNLDRVESETGTEAEEGAATGAATGGVVGGVTGLLAGIGALAIPGVGPIIAAGPIIATLSGAAVGAGAGGLVGGLIGMGVSKSEAEEYSGYVDEGRILVLVDADADRYGRVTDTFRTHRSLTGSRYDADPSRPDSIN